MGKKLPFKKQIHLFILLTLSFVFIPLSYSGTPGNLSSTHSIAQEDFTELDQKVRNIKDPASIDDLIQELKKITSTDWQKARAIYIWLTNNIAYDTRGYFSGHYSDTSPKGVFKNRVSVCQGYSELFVILGRGLGLETELISGYAKGYSYSNGRGFSGTNHAWNRVKINGKWYFMDSTWGAGYISGRSFNKSFSEYWFATPPELFVYHHLPENPEMQLLKKPITMNEYVESKYIMSYIFSSLYEIGIPFSQISETIKKEGDLVQAYSLDQYIRILSAPVAPVLKKDTEYVFSFYAPESDKMATINNGKWNFVEGENNIFTVKIKPEAGKLFINFHPKKSNKGSYHALFNYKVK